MVKNQLLRSVTRYDFDIIYDLLTIRNILSMLSLILVFTSFNLSTHFSYHDHWLSYTNSNIQKYGNKRNNTDIEILDKTVVRSVDNYLSSKYKNISFSTMKSAKDVAASFIGQDSFLALASEMEGFRGDLHKDPATGLNIGFGYNITQRALGSKNKIRTELTAIGINKNIVEEIIKLSLVDQSKLQNGIDNFNKKYNLTDKPLISVNQGIFLLTKLKSEYRDSAAKIFTNSFTKMNKHQQDVLTYAAYKAGEGNLLKYKDAINKANKIYSKKASPTLADLKLVANELSFYYKKDGKSMVLDKRAILIANSFIHQDYLSKKVGRYDKLHNSNEVLAKNEVNFSETKDKRKINKSAKKK